MVAGPIKIDGLKEFQKTVKTLDKGHRKQIRDAFKSVGQIIATQAQSNARSVFVSRSGDLARKIKPKLLARGVIIEASARHPRGLSGTYNYPGRLEFDPKINRPRAATGRFFYHAVDQKRQQAIAQLVKVLDYLERVWPK